MNNQDPAGVPEAQQLDKWFLDLLACPACEQHLPLTLNEAESTLVCGCGRYSFPIRDGIPILLLEEATVLNPDASPEAVAEESAETGR